MKNFVFLDVKIANVLVYKKIKMLRQSGINITKFVEHAILQTSVPTVLRTKLN